MSQEASFEALKFKPHPGLPGGIQALKFFANGYGASVVKHSFSYGGEGGLYELAVLAGNAKDSELTYDTPVTNDVLGYLKPSAVTDALQAIAALPVKPSALADARRRQRQSLASLRKFGKAQRAAK